MRSGRRFDGKGGEVDCICTDCDIVLLSQSKHVGLYPYSVCIVWIVICRLGNILIK
jgi:hypothetical protein